MSGTGRAERGAGGARAVLTVGLINNMPPAARSVTERQFTNLLTEAGRDLDVELHCHRTDPRELGAGRSGIEAFLGDDLDALIVTGAEPQTSSLREEPIWPVITRIVDWAEERDVPTIWSCLAAHAAVLYLDGVDRVPLDGKTSGVFQGEVVATDHPLMDGVADSWSVPHSRYNDLPEDALKASGYRVLVRSLQAGVDLFQRTSSPGFLFLQSHPEYDADSLRREFQRDIRRFQAGERMDPPALPRGYFASLAEPLRDGARICRDNVDEILAWLGQCGDASAQAPWRAVAVTFFHNWLRDLMAGKARRDGQRAAFSVGGLHPRQRQQSDAMSC
jgi:homoserine O-succinyltransferase